MAVVAVIAASGLAGCGKPAEKTTPGATASAELAAQLDAAVTQVMKDFDIPGAVVGISVPGKVDYVKTFGVADRATGTPMRLDDHIRIGSLTKTFTGTAVLQLVDQKRIALSDPISKYVPGVPSGDKITLQMLGEMRSGLFTYDDDKQWQKSILTELPKGPSAGAVTAQQLLDVAFRHPLKFEPGTQYDYSNTNAVLLGMVVEKVSGLSLPDYLQQHIFTPLKLTRTSWPSDGNMPAPYAHGYTNQTVDGTVADATLWNPSWANAAGQLISTYADMKTWDVALGKGSLLSAETQKKRLEAKEVVPGNPAYKYGFAIIESHGWIGHTGVIFGYTSAVFSIPAQNATMTIFATSSILKPDKTPQAPAEHLAKVVSSIVTPDHVYSQ
ncbi:serine hydrolase [Streptomyces sp. WAC06614]|uniref:serine hydrolase domain-containing protein n=1 Tax=Streptomyces sp. WAC06614 TaxID=2487416 RepID=UPI001C8F0F4F|nr:serine hydrolase domain-containing protein [Streptomyces sp. WAC06614]